MGVLGKMKFMRVLVALTMCFVAHAHALSILHRGNGMEPQSLDPHKGVDFPESTIIKDLFEGLFIENASGIPVPGVVKEWQVDNTGTLYTFNLKESYKWSNGKPLTAHDFVYSFQRLLKPETACPMASLFWPIKNAKLLNEGSLKDINLLGVKALSPYVLEISLERPTPYFLSLLTHSAASPVPQEVIEIYEHKWTDPYNMVSNGPYKLKEWEPYSHLTLEKNLYHPDKEEISLDQVVYYPTEDRHTEVKKFRTGEIDVTDTIPTEFIKWAQEKMPDSLHFNPWAAVYYYTVNLTREPFKSHPKLALALSLSIDRQKITDQIVSGETPAFGFVPPGLLNYPGHISALLKLPEEKRYALAQKIYEEAGFSKKNPLKVELLFTTNKDHKKVAVAVASMWKKVLGVETSLISNEFKIRMQRHRAKQYDIAQETWVADYNDPKAFLELWLSSAGELNVIGYNNPAYDALLLKADQVLNPTERASILSQAEELLLKDMPVIPLYYPSYKQLITPRLKGWQSNPMAVHRSRYLFLKEKPNSHSH